jgi:hypothetical protein
MEKKSKYQGLKRILPTKFCMACERPFQYRKKWEGVWATIRFCSDRCKALAPKKTGPNKTLPPVL